MECDPFVYGCVVFLCVGEELVFEPAWYLYDDGIVFVRVVGGLRRFGHWVLRVRLCVRVLLGIR